MNESPNRKQAADVVSRKTRQSSTTPAPFSARLRRLFGRQRRSTRRDRGAARPLHKLAKRGALTEKPLGGPRVV